jgi:hypothetical protein
MSGDDKIRYCPECQLNVYNFAEMDEGEVNRLLMEREGKVCAKIYQRASGRVVTKHAPVAFRVLPFLPGSSDKLQPDAVDLLIGKPQQILPEARPLPPSHPNETGITLLAYDSIGSAAVDTPFFIRGPKTDSRKIPRIEHTDSTGRVRFTDLEAGSYLLGCGAASVGMSPQTIEVREGEVIAVEVELFSAKLGMVVNIDIGIVPHQE